MLEEFLGTRPQIPRSFPLIIILKPFDIILAEIFARLGKYDEHAGYGYDEYVKNVGAPDAPYAPYTETRHCLVSTVPRVQDTRDDTHWNWSQNS